MARYSNLECLFHHNGLHKEDFVFETLASTTSYLLVEAEKEFGERNKEYTFIGIEYASPGGEAPHTRFSGYDHKHVMIVLSHVARTFLNAALFELAHEVFHLLSPVPSVPASVIEEGAATYFCDRMSKAMIVQTKYSAKYAEAMRLYRKLHECNNNAARELRKKRGSLLFVTSSDILEVAPNLDAQTAHALAQVF